MIRQSKMSADPTLDIDKVTSALSSRMPSYFGPWSFAKTTQGQSNPTFILQGKNYSLVLRRKPDGNLLKSAHMVEREYEVMKALYKSDVPVPKVFYLCDDITEIGSVYFVMEFVNGVTFSEPQLPNLTPEQRKKIYDSMNASLASLHKVKPNIIGLSDFGRTGNYFERQLSRWSQQFELTTTDKVIEMETLRDWLAKNIPKEINEPRLVHGDWRIDNLIFSKHDFSLLAVVDWELSTIGDPRADLATQLMQWSMPMGKEGRGLLNANRTELGIPSNESYVEEYSKRAGLTELPDLEFAIAFCFFKMAAIMQGVKKRALDGNASNPEQAIKMGEYVPIFARSALDFIKK